MCGLVGVIGKPDFKEIKALKELILIDSMRGYDSTGLTTVSNRGEVNTFKRAVPGWTFLEFDANKTKLTTGNSLYMGHNRAATVGIVNEVNAHPFTHGSFTGCHNGTLTSRHGLLDSKDFSVDSENIINTVSRQGVKETIRQLDGAYALTIYDEEEEKLYIARNSERTLYHTTTANGTIFYASDADMLTLVLNRGKIKHTDPVMYAIHTLYEYDLDPTAYVSKNVVTGLKKTPYTAYVAPVTAHYASNWRGHQHAKPATPAALPPADKPKPSVLGKINTKGWTGRSKALLKSLGIIKLDDIEAVCCEGDTDTNIATAVSLDGEYEVLVYGMDCDEQVEKAKKIADDPNLFLKFSNIIGIKKVKEEDGTAIIQLMAYITDVILVDWKHASDYPLEEEEKDGVEDIYFDNNLRPLTRKEFMRRYSSCIWCSDTLDPDDSSLEVVDANTALCGTCVDQVAYNGVMI